MRPVPASVGLVMTFRRLWMLALLGLATGGNVLWSAENLAVRVVLLANRDDADSVRIAEHYAEARGVPMANIISLSLSREETISWTEFIRSLWRPLQEELVARKWIDAIPMALTDAVGRRKYAISGHRISFLVVCRGVPLRIQHDPTLAGPAPPFTNSPQFRTNEGAVDSELSLLAQTVYPINAFVPNVLFRNERPNDFERSAVVKVARLDGPTFDDANQLVDRALVAEATGLLGRAYVDIGGQYPEGDQWLETAVKNITLLGFDTEVDRAPETFAPGARFDAPALYLGWYAGGANGPFLLPGFEFPPGAIAEHIHSYSAATVRSAGSNWVGPLVARGVTATVGNVFEPYLQYLHRPDLLVRALARGENFGDAAYYSLPVLSWQSVAIGDPLYRPFAVSAAEQWGNFERLPPRLAGYAVLRRMHQLDADGRADAALSLARSMQLSCPSYAVGFELARRLRVAGDQGGAVEALGFALFLDRFRPDEWGLVRATAALLEQLGAPSKAVQVYRQLLRVRQLPRDLRMAWTREARTAAASAGDLAQAAAWERDLSELLAPSGAGAR